MMQNLNRENSFEEYGAEPSALVWEKIQKQLPPPRERKFNWLLWGMVPVLVSGVFLSVYLFDIDIKLKNKETTTEKPVTPAGSEANTGPAKASEKNQIHVTEHSEKNNSVLEEEKVAVGAMVSPKAGKKAGINQNQIFAAAPLKESAAEKSAAENKITLTEQPGFANESITTESGFINFIPPLTLSVIPTDDNSAVTLQALSTDFQPAKKKFSVSRWQLSVTAGENYNYRALNFPNNNFVNEGEKNYLSENEKGIGTFALETSIAYSLSTHFSISFGINYFTVGQERSQAEVIFSNGTVGTPNTLYSVNTSAGTISANGAQMDYAYFNTNDTSLFTGAGIPLTGSPSPSDSNVTEDFKLRQEFSFIGLPLLIQYQPAEHRFTPYIGLGFSAAYLLKEKVTMNDKEVDYYYNKSANTIIFFAEAQAGVKYRVSNKLFVKLQPSARYGLNSLNGNDNIEWIPYSIGIGAGINFRF